MAQFSINGFAKGMDTRRPTWAALASTLYMAKDVVLNNAGDAEVRKAFVEKFTVPASTKGLRDVEDEIFVFGTAAAPAVPTGVTYQQIVTTGGVHIEQILSSDLYDGKVYLSALMSDATRRHYYDGAEVSDWFDGRARASFEITAGTAGTIATVVVNGVNVLGGAVAWATSHVATAAAVAAQINSYGSTPDYEAVSIGATVIILADDAAGSTPNGFATAVTVTGDVVVSSLTDMLDGVDDAPQPGAFVRTHDNKMYSPAGKLLNYSSIDGPTYWNTDEDGAGFVDLSRATSGAETLLAVEAFLEEMAVFARKCVQVFHVEADDLNNKRIQTFRDVGTSSIRAQAAFRETDVFFMDTYRGVLAIVPSATQNQFAKITEVGLPIQKFLKAYQATLTDAVIERALAFVEPGAARFWLVLGERVFVYSWHPVEGIEGWTYFEPGFQIEDYAIAGGRLYVRAGNVIYLYGGDDDDEYPESGVGEITFTAFRANAPERVKKFNGLDIGAEGTWESRLYASSRDTVGRVVATSVGETFEDGDVGLFEMGANPILKMTRRSDGYARVCQLIVNYTPAKSG